MSLGYQAVGWNRAKKIYDGVLAGGLALYLGVFVGIGAIAHPNATAETLLIRGFGTAALLLLHVILAIGPLCRLDRRFLPLLYNRRHLGVTMFTLALAHGALALFQFHALGDLNPLVSMFVSNTRYGSVADFPFQPLGFFALAILFLMAATSHDFWLNNLTAPVWKRLHMGVYAAYAFLVAHVTLGALQSETGTALAALLGVGMTALIALHLAAGVKESVKDRAAYVPACDLDRIPEKRACVVTCGGERVAVFKYDGKVSAVSNVCQHQNGPLGEGKIIDGCITCPWHGYQYLPDTGASPPPFTEKVSTYRTKIVGNQVFIDPAPLPPGTRVAPSEIAHV
jgi:nitrite reductase/ring-hydroxylating ferredoxin subunit/DMSO/TMAO reductase YedYZ heme-binding membrane subunit